jgi:excisionase family DNA binding protein
VSDSTLPPFTPISLRPAEAARLLGVGRSHFYKLMQAGLIPYRKGGATRLRLIDHAALVAYRDSLAVVEPELRATGPLLPHDQQQLAAERAGEPAPSWDGGHKSKPPEEASPEPLRPEIDLAALYLDRLRLLVANLGDEEGQLRARDFAIDCYRRHTGCDLEAAKVAVTAAIARTKQRA